MRKNVAGQTVAFQMISATGGGDVTTGTPSVYYTIDGGTQATGGGSSAHEGNGQWSYAPAQAETNGNHVAFTMVLSGAISQTVNAWPVSFDPTDSVRAGLTALPNAAADAAGGLAISDAGGLDLDQVGTDASTAATWGSVNNAAITTVDGVVDDIKEAVGYSGPRGPGVYFDDSITNTSTSLGTDGTFNNPVSTEAAAVTLAGLLNARRIYIQSGSSFVCQTSYQNYEFVGLEDLAANSINLNSQDVDESAFHNLLVSGAQGGTGRVSIFGGGVSGVTGLEAYVYQAAIVGNITLRASKDSYFDQCWSAVAGNGTPELTFAANADVSWRHYSGGLQLNSMAAGNTMSYETDGQIVIDATCTGGALTVRGNMTLTDNASGAVTVTQGARIDRDAINAEADTALTDYDPPTAAELATTEGVITSAIAALNDLSAAEVATEISDALRTDTIADLSAAAPAATPTIAQALMYLYSALVHKVDVDASFKEFHNNAGVVIWKKALSDDGTTYSEAEGA